jgi:stage II sporulation protein D
MSLRPAALLLWLASLTAAPREVTVRLYWLHPPAEMPQLDWKGPVEVKRQGGRLLLTVRMPLEEYVAAVLAGESSTFTSEEALKAMAVAARTYAFRHLGRHRPEGFDFCDTTHCQDLRLAGLSERFRSIAEATEAELLWYQGSPAATYYHRHCGGLTEAAHNLWPEIRAPYLREQADTFCLAPGRGDWHSQVSKEELAQALGIRSLEVLRRTSSGRVAELRAGRKLMSGPAFEQALGRALGWDLVRSNRFEIIDRGDRLVFQGYGFGHGVGLCQTGAQQRGAQGHSYRQILEFYYPGTVLGVTAQGFTWAHVAGEQVELASTRVREDQFLVALADRLLREAESRAGFSLGFRPHVRVYPSVAAFRDSTGEPGWVAASTLGRTVRLQPLPLLRSTGRLEATLLHEMLHLLIESRAHPSLPPWFREGLALYLTDAQGPRRREETRIRALVERHGRAALMDWLAHGLPR